VVNVPDGGKVDVTRSASEPPRLAPPAAVAPFDAAQAREYQEQWAKYLGVPVEMTNSIGMKLVLIPPGEFDMGSSSEETSRLVQEIAAKKEDPWYAELTKLETPRHRVRISKPFYMGVYEVTQAEYERVTGNNPSEFSAKGKSAAAVKGQDTARFPVESVCWENAAEFCRKLSALPEESSQGRLYRLPTEAEWENACKAGTTGPEPWDDANLAKDAWFVRNSAAKPHPVGLKQPNAWGLYDMLGNVLEFCSDWDSLDYYAKSPFADPVGPSSGTSRVARGGSYWMSALSCRSTYRYRFPPTMADLQNGFRVVLSVWRPEQSTAKAPSVKTASGAAAAPSLAAPAFDAVQARKHQEQWAQHLGAAAQFTNSVGMKLVLIPPGEFDMGSTPEEINRLLGEIAAKKQDRWYAELTQGEAPRHRVCITRPFYMGVYEVTQAEYERVMGYNPSEFSSKGKGAAATKGEDTGRLPVESVSWDDAADFCRSLSALPEEKSNRRVYRLPTEAEWEYANKAGTTGPRPWDEAALGKEAWFQSNSSTKTHSVGMKRANAWGLYDMLGNVSEWCSDWVGEDYYAKSPFADPTGPSFGQGRAVRGGGFGFPAISCRCTYRYRYAPEWFSWYSGFRVVLTEWSTAPSSQNAQPAVVQPAKR
jgi:formylglycine-generating enzyme required for sulfatase activity